MTRPKVVLDAVSHRLVDAARFPPHLYTMGPADGRTALTEMQSAPLPAGIRRRIIEAPTRYGKIRTHLLLPEGNVGGPPAPLVVYAHGGGWQIGDYRSHARFASLVALRSALPVLLVEYGRTPECRYPRPVHEIADTLAWARDGGLGADIDATHVGLLGDCAGATLMAAVSLTARTTPVAQALAMLYPMTVPAVLAAPDFDSGYLLRLKDVRHLWHEYVPRPASRTDIAAAPLTAPADLAELLPPTLVITAEADVTRDPAEEFCARMRQAGAPVSCVRYLGVVHDFAVLDALSRTAPARTAISQAAGFLRDVLTSDPQARTP